MSFSSHMEDDKQHKRSSSSSGEHLDASKFARANKDAEQAHKAPWRALFAFTTKAHIPLIVAGALMSTLAGAMGPASNLIIGEVVQNFTSFATGSITKHDFMREGTKMVTYMVGIAAGSWIFHSLEFMFWLAFGELQAKSARDRLFNGLLEKDIEWYDRRKNGIGALLPRLQAQIRELQLSTSQPLGSLFQLTSTAVLSLIQAFVVSWDLTLVTLATVPLVVIAAGWVGSGMQTNINKQQDKLTEAQKYSTSAFSAIDTVKCFNGQEIELQKYNKCVSEAAVWYAWVAHASALQMALVVLLSTSMFVQGFYYGGIVVTKGKIDTGDVVTTFFSAIGAFQAIQAFLPQMIVFEKGRTAGSTLRAIMAHIQGSLSVERAHGLMAPASCRGDINVERVSFAYPSRPDQLAIEDVSMYIPSGQMTFLIGKSGSGKSTISQLLMRFYASSEGVITVDGYPLASLDPTWLRSNVTLVEQTSLLFNDTVFRNIAFGRKDWEQVTKAEVMEAAEFALLQLMISDMPEGLGTPVGFKGGSISGGQRQRMALARARIRDTPVLILDESTSALDHISRTLMMEAIRLWRRGKTTIIITHDISQIMADDYVYLLESGRITQEGLRKHMEKMKESPFQGFLSEDQRAMIPPCDARTDGAVDPVRTRGSSLDSFAHIIQDSEDEDELDLLERELTLNENRASNRISYFPIVLTEGSPIFGMRSYTNKGGPTSAFASPWVRMANIAESTSDTLSVTSKRRSSLDAPARNSTHPETPAPEMRWSQVLEKLVDQTGRLAVDARRRTLRPVRRRQASGDSQAILLQGPEDALAALEANKTDAPPMRLNSLKAIFSTLWPSLDWQGKVFLVLGFWGASVHAVASPLFSYVLTRLLQTYQVPGGEKKKALMWSMAILGIAIADASHTWAFRFFHEYTGQLWVDRIRASAYEKLLDQSRNFFEKEENGVSRLTESLDRNAEEMRNLLGRFASLAYVAVLMMAVSIVWAVTAQWKMTLIALAVSPYIYAVTKAYARISEKWEARSNDAAAVAGAIFNETFTNIKTVRALTMESHFTSKYLVATRQAVRIGFRRAFYSGFFFGLSDSAGSFSIAMIFYVGTRLVADGVSANDMIQVFTMLIMCIANVSAILEYIPQMGSSKDTAARLFRLANLPRDSHEHLGDTRITTVGEIVFDDLRFAYPSRPEQSILKNISLHLSPGTTTAIVGSSGSGKSTIANLLLDLYSTATVPGAKTGDLTFGGRDLKRIYTPSLRALVVPVSQTPVLFAATAAENIVYGVPEGSPNRTRESMAVAARQAGIHDFIVSLPSGYDTLIGEGGLGLSGGQAQRIAIARALVRKPSVLILDEATSALDVESANLVRHTIKQLIDDKSHAMTVIIITHHKDMMQIAERIVVLEQGGIAESGSFDELMKKNGALANLLGGGAWDDERETAQKPAKIRGPPKLKDVDWSRRGPTKSRNAR